MVMTAQPGKVKMMVDVPLKRPRNIMELQKTPEYGELIHHIWSSLREEVQRARQQERRRHERATDLDRADSRRPECRRARATVC